MAPKKGKSSASGQRNTKGNKNKSVITIATEGEKPSEFISHIGRLTAKQKSMQFDQMYALTRFPMDGFMSNLDKNRAPVPIPEKKRVKLSTPQPGDHEYVPASYCVFEREDYILFQAPTKADYGSFWRVIWQDGCRIIVSMTESSGFSESDSGKCYPYWPREEKDTITYQDKRVVVKMSKKSENKGYTVYDLLLTCTDESDAAKMGVDSDAEGGERKEKEDPGQPRQITLMHFDTWSPEKWPDIDQLAGFVQALTKKELQVIRKSTDSYVPPVVIQGNEAIGRSAVVWVANAVMKDIEKRECFDIDDILKKLIRMRPGACSRKIYYFSLYAVCLRLSSLGGWTNNEDMKEHISDIKAAARKKKA